MTVNRGLWVPINTGNVGTTEIEARLADNALFESNDGINARSGLLNPQSTTIVTGKANMSYDIAACNPVINRVTNEGVYRFTATGTTNIATTAAPAANSRIDVICLKQNDQSKGDANNLAVAVVLQGAVAASPVAPAIPAGHLELARATVGPNITATTSASITQTFRHAALKGQVIPVRNVTERAEITVPRVGQRVHRLDITTMPFPAVERWDGAAWDTPYQYAEYFANSFAVAGGLVNWDAGPMSNDAAKSFNNSFSNTSGALSGAINITENGLYTVTFLGAPRAATGRNAVLCKTGSGNTLGAGASDGILWEEACSFTRYLLAGTYVRFVILQVNSTTNDSVVSILKHSSTWT